MTSRKDKKDHKDSKVIRMEDFKVRKELNHYVRTHMEMEKAWQFACSLLQNTSMRGLDPINVHLSLYKLMVLKLQHDGYDYHSLRRILHNIFNEE